MITEVLALAWFSMCAAMLYVDPRLWIILASSIAFTAARVFLAPNVAARVKTFAVLSNSNQLLWFNTFISMLHSTISSLLAIYAIAMDHSMAGDYVNRASYWEFVTTSVSTGYFAYDLWDFMLNRLYIKAPGIVAHHVVILICYISALTKTVGVPLLSLALICELHSAFMHLRKLMSMSGYSLQAPSAYRLVWAGQWITFAAARMLPHIAVTILTYQGYSLFTNNWYFGMAFIGMIFIDALNIQLFVQVRGAYRKDSGVPRKTVDKKTS